MEEAGAGPSAWRMPGKQDLYIQSISLLVVLDKVLPILLCISFDAMRGHLSPLFASLEKG